MQVDLSLDLWEFLHIIPYNITYSNIKNNLNLNTYIFITLYIYQCSIYKYNHLSVSVFLAFRKYLQCHKHHIWSN